MDGSTALGLTVGEAIRLLPVVGGRLLQGTVVAVPGGDPGDVGGWIRVSVLPRVGGWMDGVRVWVLSGPGDRGPATVHEARLLVRSQLPDVNLTDISLLADEPRRNALRASARRPVLLLRPGKVSSGTTSLDLSSTGCRVTVPTGQELSAGQVVQVAVDLDAGSSVWADGQVVWVDDDAGVAALRFTRVDPADQERLDRGVLSALSPRFGRPNTVPDHPRGR
jgi:hypothetical protein